MSRNLAARARSRPWIWRVLAGRPRLFVGLLAGLAAYAFVPASLNGGTRAVVAWDAGVTVFLTLAGILFTAERKSRMSEDAERQQEGEWTVFFLTVGAIIASFAVIFVQFSASKGVPAGQRALHLGLVVFTLLSSWLMSHTTFALRYAHEYYSLTDGASDYDRGLDFPGEAAPDYWDFMYFALVLGMTFQVSDVQITSRKLRRLATMHGFLSFLFNTVILALTVNLAAGLV